MLILFQGVMGASKDPRYSRLGLEVPDYTEFTLHTFGFDDTFVFTDMFGAHRVVEVQREANGTLLGFRVDVAFSASFCPVQYDLRVNLPRSIGGGDRKCGLFEIGVLGQPRDTEDVVFCAPVKTLIQSAGVAGMVRLMSSNESA